MSLSSQVGCSSSHEKPKDADLDDKRAVLGTNFGSIKVLDLQRMQLVSSGYLAGAKPLQIGEVGE